MELQDLPLASPALGMEYYESVRKSRLDFSEQARENYRKFIDASKREAVPSYRPIKMDIEPVSRCNFRCQMCVVSTWDKGKRADDLSFEHFKEILDSEPQLLEIKLQGLGEPLMVGDSLFAMILYARSQRIWVRTTTNASLLHKNNNTRKLVDSGICEVQVSIDGSKAETMEGIRQGSKASRVFKNCEELNNYANSIEYPVTKMWTVVQKDNFYELEDLVSLASRLGFKSQCFSLDLHGWGIEDWVSLNNRKTVDTSELSQRLKNLVNIGRQLGVRVEFWKNVKKYSIESTKTLCDWPFERLMVSSDMRVTPCCMISNPDVLEIGKGLPYKEVWDSESFIKFRESHLSGLIPKACANCYE